MSMANQPKGSLFPPGKRVLNAQEDLFADAFLRYFGEKELMAIRPVCRAARDAANRYLWWRYTAVSGASSVIPAQASKSDTLRDKIMQRIKEIKLAGGTARIASDQITDAAFFRGLLGPSLTIVLKVNAGSKVPEKGVSSLPGDAKQVDGPTEKGKAHAKFITGPGGVFLGSPNYTPNALGGGTVESGVAIRNLSVQAYFNRYFDLMRAGTVNEDQQFSRMLHAFNNANRPISLALAPFVEIQPWLMAQVGDADRLIIRMFLISYFKDGNDIVSGLNALARKNPAMTIDVYVDEGQYNDSFSEFFVRGSTTKQKDYYVREACSRLMQGAANVRVFTQTGTRGIMHDKLILAEKDLDAKGDSPKVAKRLILGSSGFSQHVMHNYNFDIMVRIDQDALYDYMVRHHQATLTSKAFNTKRIP